MDYPITECISGGGIESGHNETKNIYKFSIKGSQGFLKKSMSTDKNLKKKLKTFFFHFHNFEKSVYILFLSEIIKAS